MSVRMEGNAIELMSNGHYDQVYLKVEKETVAKRTYFGDITEERVINLTFMPKTEYGYVKAAKNAMDNICCALENAQGISDRKIEWITDPGQIRTIQRQHAPLLYMTITETGKRIYVGHEGSPPYVESDDKTAERLQARNLTPPLESEDLLSESDLPPDSDDDEFNIDDINRAHDEIE